MKVWYIHALYPYAHERNWYRLPAIRRSWEADGHEFRMYSLRDKSDLRRLERGNDTADVAFICGFDASEILRGSRMSLSRAKFRVYITGEGWRRPPWQRRGLQGIEDMRPHLVFLSHRPRLDLYRKVHKRVFYVGLGFAPEVFYPKRPCAFEGSRDRGIVFCGNPAMGRERRLRLLADRFPGQVEWRQGLSHSEMADFLRSGRVGWNQVANGPPRDHISCNLRVYELLGCGTMLFCSRSKHIDFLEDGRHCVFWDDDKDMIRKAKYYLTHEKERGQIAERGYKEAVENHTWAHRAQEYKNIIEGYL